jgi:hypothetical protein
VAADESSSISAVFRALAAVAIAGGLLVSAGCGSGSAAPNTFPGAAEQLISPDEVDQHPPGSPARAFLLWWRDAQYANVEGFESGFVRALRTKLRASAKSGDALNYFAGAIRTALPTVRDVSRNGTNATVYTIIHVRQPIGTTKYTTSTIPRAFPMKLEQGQWRLRDDFYVQSTLPKSLRRTEAGAVTRPARPADSGT